LLLPDISHADAKSNHGQKLPAFSAGRQDPENLGIAVHCAETVGFDPG
jgi:hypothetical protein